MEAPPGSPHVGVVQVFHGASHALALGKVLIAGYEGARDYVVGFGLAAFTPKTIVRPDLFESHLSAIRARGFATDVEEFAENLCCVAVPIIGEDGEVEEGAIGVSTSVGRFAGEARSLVAFVRHASDEASRPYSTGRPARPTTTTGRGSTRTAGGILAAASVLAYTALNLERELHFDAVTNYFFAQEADASQPMLGPNRNHHQTGPYDI